MKTFFIALLGISLSVLSQPNQAQALDELDELLAGAAVSTSIPEAEATPATFPELTASELSGSHGAVWHPEQAHHHAVVGSTVVAAATGGDNNPLSGVSVVPEPSALALAGLAAVYFAIFCRRRHYV